jgi:hypothetical protein
MNNYHSRPTFYLHKYNNKYNNHIRASGILFYNKNTKKVLMIKKDGKYEDFGGKTDIVDNHAFDTACRETEEESNGIFSQKELLAKYDLNNIIPIDNIVPPNKYKYDSIKVLATTMVNNITNKSDTNKSVNITNKIVSNRYIFKNGPTYKYSSHGKYIVYLIELTEHIDPILFGEMEIHDNLVRTVEWINVKKLRISQLLHYRLHNINLFNSVIKCMK